MRIPRGSIQHGILSDFKSLTMSVINHSLCESATKKTREKLEKKINHYFQNSHSILFPFARTALYGVLKSLNLPKDSKILMTPFNITPMIDIIESLNLKVDFIDINLNDYGPDYEILEKTISKDYKCFIMTYLFGYVPNIELIKKLCLNNNVMLIEDISQNIGAKYNGKLLGTFGKVSIYSASLTKYVDGYNGGFAITQDLKLKTDLINFSYSLKRTDKVRIVKVILKTLIWNIALNKYFFKYITYNLLSLLKRIAYDKYEKILSGSITKHKNQLLPEYYFESIAEIQCLTISKYLDCLEELIRKRRKLVQKIKLLHSQTITTLGKNNNKKYETFWQYLLQVNDIKRSREILFRKGVETGTTNLPNLSKFYKKNLVNAEKIKNNHIFLPLHTFVKESDYMELLNLLISKGEITQNLSLNKDEIR